MSTPERTLYLIRGIPGSGKSTLAYRLTPLVFEADHYRERSGAYVFDPSEHRAAHEDCQRRTRLAMRNAQSPIAVANTFVRAWEAAAYFEMAEEHGYTVCVVEMQNRWPNVHDVPADVVAMMLDNWEPLR